MIVPMLKYSFVVFHKDYDDFIGELRAIGKFHIKEQNEQPENVKNALRETSHLNEIFDHYKNDELILNPDNSKIGKELPSMVTEDWRDNLLLIELKEKELRGLQQELNLLNNTLGKFSTLKLHKLKSLGLYPHLFSCKTNSFSDNYIHEFGAVKINDGGRKTYFIVFDESEETPPVDSQIESFPERGTEEVENLIAEKKEEIKEVNNQLNFIKNNHLFDLQYTIEKLKDSIELESVSSQSKSSGEGKIHCLETWIPNEKLEEVNSLFDSYSVYYETSEPNLAERNPILLKNNNYSKLFEPIGSLFSLPNYGELDLTPLFAPFFTLFFGFCLGDAGYGFLILVGITIFGKKLGEENKGIVRLAQVMGVSTILFGVITGTIFGVNLGAENSTLLPENLKSLLLDSNNLFALSLVLGWIQIIFGMVVRIINQFKQSGFVYTLSTFGWIILTFGLTHLGLSAYEFIPSNIIAPILSWVGVGLILFFNDPKAGVLTRIGKGIWELYGITGLFGDLLSYIRLFALGLSSSILGFVINDIGLSVLSLDYVGPIFFVIIMIIGHSLNIFIAGLGAFVHPMRLTFVEFYKNAGFSGGGMKYKPFKKTFK